MWGTRRGKSSRAETYRLKRLCQTEAEIRNEGFKCIAGIDEAGRGPLAGPVVAAACILPQGYVLRGIDDSKELLPEERLALFQELVDNPSIAFATGIIEPLEIDRLNIHVASLEAMQKAIESLPFSPDFLLVDGKYTPNAKIPAAALVEGEKKTQAIAAASILAKVIRDHIMLGYDVLFPHYGFGKHKGYGTKTHIKAVQALGLCPIHRRSFIRNG